MSNQVCDEKFLETIERINPKLKFYCQHLSFCSKIVESDDLYQEALLKLLERSRTDPMFLDQNDSYVICYGVWMAKNYINHQRNLFYKKVTEEDDLDLGEPEYHLRVNHAPNPEAETVKNEIHQIAEGMPEQYRTIFDATVQGYGSDEIASMLKMGKYAYARRKKIMVETLGKAWRAPQSERKHIIREM